MTTDQPASPTQYYPMPPAGWLQTLEERLKKIPEFGSQLDDIRGRACLIVHSRSNEKVDLIAQGISKMCKRFDQPDVESDDSQLYLTPYAIFQIHQDSDDVRVGGILDRIKSSESIAVGALVALNHVYQQINDSKKLSLEQTKIVIDALLFGEWVFLMKEFRKEVRQKVKVKDTTIRRYRRINSKSHKKQEETRNAIAEHYNKNLDKYAHLSANKVAQEMVKLSNIHRGERTISEIISKIRNNLPINKHPTIQSS